MRDDQLFTDVAEQEFYDFVRSFEASLVVKSYIYKRLPVTDYLFLCSGAKAEILRRRDIPAHLVPVMRSKEVELPKLYEFENTTRVAIKCPSAPPMYIYFKAPRVNKEEALVVLVTDGSEPQLTGTTSS